MKAINYNCTKLVKALCAMRHEEDRQQVTKLVMLVMQVYTFTLHTFQGHPTDCFNNLFCLGLIPSDFL